MQTEFVNFFKEIGSILQCIQDSFYILSNDEIYSIKKQFTKLIVIEEEININFFLFLKNLFGIKREITMIVNK